MSRAFIKEDAGDPDELPERHQSAAPNYVTPEGLAALRQRAAELRGRLKALSSESREAKEVKRDLRYFDGRLASAIPVDPKVAPLDEVRFGARVELQAADGKKRTVTIVGQDEAEGAPDKAAWDSALALSLMGTKKGERAETEEAGTLTVLSFTYPGR
ncbi:MAG: GreA/GreB family elongation factor [Elusimicrobia bacterium]|nr:GreA/GreB family elongation factor [Elusimicrobiota bacterium]